MHILCSELECEEEFKLVKLTKMSIKNTEVLPGAEHKQIMYLAAEVIQEWLVVFSVVPSACWVK